MSTYIAFELDAMEQVPNVAAACALSEAQVGWGMAKLWRWCWREKTATVTATHLRGFFGVDVTDALEAFGFIARDGSTLRVRGAEKYLRITAGRSKGGHAAKGNLIAGPHSSQKSAGDPAGGTSPAPPPADLRHVSGLSANSEQRTATSEQPQAEEAAPAAQKLAIAAVPVGLVAPTAPPEHWDGLDFWRWAQVKREGAGFLPQAPPGDLSKWWSAARMAASADELQRAFYAFGDDPHWLKATPPLPFGAFQKQWPNFVPRRKTS